MTTKAIEYTRDLQECMRTYGRLVNLDRAIPDARDGLKPVQRRILYAMYQMGLRSDRPHKKSARVVGEVLGKYHPHGDQSVYDAMVRLAQDFSCAAPLIDGQGNFGSIDNGSAAAMRYTEARLAQVAEWLLTDLATADCVPWQENFDDSLKEPVVLPSRIPNLLLNGSSGIAVGMATSIPPHNLGELCAAINYLVANWDGRDEITTDDLMNYVPGPDFPTGGILFRYRKDGQGVADEIRNIYESGNGKPILQAVADIEAIGGGKHYIIISEIPYQLSKSAIIEKIAKEVRGGRIEGVTDIRDESDFNGMRVVIETARGHRPETVLKSLYKYSGLRSTASAQMMALPDETGRPPAIMSLKELLTAFIEFRLEVIRQRSIQQRDKLAARLHIVEGLLKALASIDEVIALIRGSVSRAAAREALQDDMGFTEAQAQAIVAMPLGNLANLEHVELEIEGRQLAADIERLDGLINFETQRLGVVAEETTEVSELFAIPRRTRIMADEEVLPSQPKLITAADLREPQIVRVQASGKVLFTPAMSPPAFRKNQPVLRQWHQPADAYTLLGSAKGLVWLSPTTQLEAYFEPGGQDKVIGGGAVADLADPDLRVVIVTKQGKIKLTTPADLRVTQDWNVLMGLADDDEVIHVSVAQATDHALFFTRLGKGLRIDLGTIRPQASATATGVAGIKLSAKDELLSVESFNPETTPWVIVLSETGFAKRVALDDFNVKGRGTGGMATLNTTKATGSVACGTVAHQEEEVCHVYLADGVHKGLALDDLPVAARAPRGDKLFTGRPTHVLCLASN